MRRLLAAYLQPSIRRPALKVSLCVGTLLNLINQAGPAWQGDALSWVHVFLNYLIPFCVSSDSAAKNEIARNTR